jgi:hypothetical protein
MTTPTEKEAAPEAAAPAERPSGDPRTLPTVVFGIVGALLVLLIVIALETLYYGAEQGEEKRKVIDEAPAELENVQAQQEDELHGYRWVDQAKGIVAIPIDRAMEVEARDLNAAQGEGP